MSKTKITVEPGASQIIITRGLDAPRDLVFRAIANPEPLVRRLGSRDLTTTVDRSSPAPGRTADPGPGERGMAALIRTSKQWKDGET